MWKKCRWNLVLAQVLEWYHLWFTRLLFSKYSFSCHPRRCWVCHVISFGVLMGYRHLPTFWSGAWPCDLIYSMRHSQLLFDQWHNVSLCAYLPFHTSCTPAVTMRRTCLGCLLVQKGWGTVVQTKLWLISCSPSQLTRPRLAKLQVTQRHVSKTSIFHCQVCCCVRVVCHRITVVKANWNNDGYWCKCREIILVSPVGGSENIKEGSEEDEGSLTKGRGR